MAPELKRLFGDHSFFLTASGLHFIEPAGENDATTATGRLVRIASWTNPNHNALKPHEPEATDSIVELEEPASVDLAGNLEFTIERVECNPRDAGWVDVSIEPRANTRGDMPDVIERDFVVSTQVLSTPGTSSPGRWLGIVLDQLCHVDRSWK